MEDADLVRPDGLSVRRRRHDQKWSMRQMVEAIAEASRVATGLPTTITPNLLMGIEEQNELIPYETLRLVARGLDCDPIDISGE
jgi:hypothetical protein